MILIEKIRFIIIFKKFIIFELLFNYISIDDYIWFDLSHTPIWHQPEVGLYGRTIEIIKELNEKKILRPNPKIKTLFNRQKQRGVTTLFHHFNTNESYNSCPHKKKKNKTKSKKWNQIHQHWVFTHQRFVFVKQFWTDFT